MFLKSKEKVTKNYDVIIVGSGLAGMTAANKMAKAGRQVLLLESHAKLGGFATWFLRSGGEHIFDVSLHGFPAGMIKTCKKYWNRELANSIVQLKNVRFINPQFSISTDFTKEDFIRILLDTFKLDEKTVTGFFSELESMNYYDDLKMTNGELFNKYFPGRNDVVRFLLEPITYANGSTLEDEAITYGIVFSNFINKGVFTFQGGTDVIIGKMADELVKNGVDILRRARVTKILVENGRAKGVELGDKKIFGSSVFSNSNLIGTINNLVGKEHFSSNYIEQADKVRINTSSCQVYMGLKAGETIPDVGDLIFYSTADSFSTNLLLDKDVTSQTFSIYYPQTRPHLDNKYSIVSSSNARFEDWDNLSDEEYKKRKEDLIENALIAIEKIIPGVTEKINYCEAATPRTIKRYTGHLKGSSFGTKFEGLDISMNMHKEIDGLFHSGSVGIIMSGWLGAANYGVIQSYEVEKYLESVLVPADFTDSVSL